LHERQRAVFTRAPSAPRSPTGRSRGTAFARGSQPSSPSTPPSRCSSGARRDALPGSAARMLGHLWPPPLPI
jgi:hypothetical protein